MVPGSGNGVARWLRRSTLVAAAFVVGLLGTAASFANAQASSGGPTSSSMAIPVNRQDYVTSTTTTNPKDGSTVDQYGADPSSIHVAINGGTGFARSFVHLALEYLPPAARPEQVTMTLHLTQQSDASSSGAYPLYNVNTSAAIIEACALTTELPVDFDYKNPPAYDCQDGSAVGKPDAAGDTWTFQLRTLLGYWAQHGNTGAALLPVGSGDPSQNWAVAFYKSRSSAVASFTTASAGSGASASPATSASPAARSGPKGTGQGASGGARVVPPTPAGAGSPGSSAAPGSSASPGSSGAPGAPSPSATTAPAQGGTGLALGPAQPPPVVSPPSSSGTGASPSTSGSTGVAAGSGQSTAGALSPSSSGSGSASPSNTGTSAPGSQTAVVGRSGTTSASPGQAGPGGGGNVANHWPWVLLGCLVLAGGAVAVAHRGPLEAWAGRVVGPALGAFRVHPRSYTVAAVALTWGVVFSLYSVLLQPVPSGSSQTSLAAGNPSQRSGSTGGGTGSGQGGRGSGQGGTGSGQGAASLGTIGSGQTGAPAGGAGTAGAGQGTTGAGGAASALGGGLAATTGPGPSGPGTAPGPGAAGATGTGATGPVSTGTRGQGGSAPGQGLPSPSGSGTQATGAGTYRTINGVQVFFPANGGPPVANLYQGADNTVGITPSTIKLCAHAALTYGSAFNINASDLNVYWDWLNAHGGIYGRQVQATYQNDNYDPGTAVQAAQACKDWGTFVLLGGIGFDQIPAVRQWAEQNQELYIHHIATIEGTEGLRYSFSSQPTVEQVGTWFGQLAVQQFRGKKIGILYRDSSNWTPGVSAFEQVVKAAGMSVVAYPVTINQGNYTQELAQLSVAGVQVVWGWENALAEVEMIKQAQGQNYHPSWLIFPFNLETNTLGSSTLDQQLWGITTWDPYDPGYYGGGFAPYAGGIHEFEAEYKQYDPSADLSGDGGDLLFLNWEGQRQIADLLQECGPRCTRNTLAGIMLAGYHRTVPPACDVNFARTDDHHHGGYLFDVVHAVRDPNGRPNFVPVQRCVASVGGG